MFRAFASVEVPFPFECWTLFQENLLFLAVCRTLEADLISGCLPGEVMKMRGEYEQVGPSEHTERRHVIYNIPTAHHLSLVSPIHKTYSRLHAIVEKSLIVVAHRSRVICLVAQRDPVLPDTRLECYQHNATSSL